MANLGTLTLDLIAKIAGFTEPLSKAEREASKRAKAIEASMAKIGGAAAAIGVAAGAAVVSWTKDLARMAADVEKFAQLSNTTTSNFQGLAYGAGTVGIANEKLADIFKDVNDKVGDFMQTGAGPLADFFENIAPRVGVTADQFRKLSGPEALGLYVSSLEKAGVSQSEMTFYMEAIASDATALIPLLRNNGQAWNALSAEAKAFGVVLDSDVFQAARDLDRQMKQLDAIFGGFKNQIAGAVVPTLVALTTSVKEVVLEANELENTADRLRRNNAFRDFAEGAGREITKLLDMTAQAKKELAVLIDFGRSYAQAAGQLATLDFAGARQTGAQFRERYGLDENGRRQIAEDGRTAARTFVQAYDDQLSRQARARFAATDPRRLGDVATIGQQTGSAGVGTGTKPRPAGSKPVDPLAEAKRYLEALQSQAEALQNLSTFDKALKDLQLDRLGKITPQLREQILQLALGIDRTKDQADAEKALTKAMEDQARARQTIADMTTRIDDAAIAEVDALINGNAALREEIQLIGLDEKSRAALEQARIASTVALKEEELVMLQNAGATSTQIEAMQRQIRLLRERSGLLGQKGEFEAIAKQTAETERFAAELGRTFSSSFEDAITGGKKLSDVIKGLGADISKIVIRSLVTEPLGRDVATWAKGLTAGTGSGGGFDFGKLFGSLFGGSGGGSFGFATGGYTGSGGMFEPAGIVHRGEYVLDAATTRRLGVPALDNIRAGGGMGMTVNQSINVLPGASRETAYQAARDAGRELQRARR